MNVIVFVINCMTGGGAERVLTTLARYAAEHGIKPIIVLSGQQQAEAILYDGPDLIEYRSLVDKPIPASSGYKKYAAKFAGLMIKIAKRFGKKPSDHAVILKYTICNHVRIQRLREIIKEFCDVPIIAFLDDSIYLSLLASRGTQSKIILSERSDTSQHNKSVRASACIQRLYKQADCIICQTDEASEYYAQHVPSLKRVVIANPITKKLPEPFLGKRRHVIVDFCRLDPPKNLPLLIDAFALIAPKYRDYQLEIIGEPAKFIDISIVDKLQAKINSLGLKERAKISPFRADIHDYVRDCTMFVSSSDYEGLSNSMLEALAIGLPTVCTDCLGGGARMIIDDGINGLLVPRNDPKSLADAMERIIDDPQLAKTISINSVKVRELLNADKICIQWMNVISESKNCGNGVSRYEGKSKVGKDYQTT